MLVLGNKEKQGWRNLHGAEQAYQETEKEAYSGSYPLLRDREKGRSTSHTKGFYLTDKKLQNVGIFIQTYKNKTKKLQG